MAWATKEQIRKARYNSGNPYAYQDDTGQFSGVINSASPKDKLQQLMRCLQARMSNGQLEERINELLNWAWENRQMLWATPPQSRLDLLDPLLFLELLGYEITSEDSLGSVIHHGKEIQVGGVIDTSTKTIRYSNDPSLHARRQKFTLAHELGHACLHTQASMQYHRDIAIDAPLQGRNREEAAADKFATLFLMPRNYVKRELQKRFDSEPILLCELTEFRLGELNMQYYKKSTKHDGHRMALAKTVAQTTSFGERQFTSMAEQFGVSVTAMAIRLIELELV